MSKKSLNTRGLSALFDPKVVAHVGASESENGSGVPTVMRGMFENLLDGEKHGRRVYPVNPKRETVLGVNAYPDIGSIPEKIIDCVVITIGAAHYESILKTIEQCHQKKVKAIIMPTAGFSEAGAEGKEHERKIVEALKGKIRLVGTNCLGVVCPHTDFNATFVCSQPPKGRVAFFTQSGGMAAPVTCHAISEHFGFSRVVSIGSGPDVNMNDLLAFAASDPLTDSVCLYMETVNDARNFMSAVKMVRDAGKFIAVIKPGKTEAAGAAAKSHTGSLVGSDDVFEAAMERAGIPRVESIADFYNVMLLSDKIKVLECQEKVALLSHAGGPGVIATDAFVGLNGKLASISPQTMEKLNALLPPIWSHANPIDMTGGVGAKEYGEAAKILLEAPEVDILHITLAAIVTVRPDHVAEVIATTVTKAQARGNKKPVVVSFMGGADWKLGDGLMDKARDIFRDAHIPNINNPDQAVRAIQYLIRGKQLAKELNAMPKRIAFPHLRDEVKKILAEVRADGRTTLTTYEAMKVFSLYNIPVIGMEVAETEAAAVLNYIFEHETDAVVMKLHSKTISHKTDVGGVKLNLKNRDEVRKAFREIEADVTEKLGKEHFQGVTISPMVKLSDGYEIILGSTTDPQWGPTVMFGLGGILVEILKDKSIGIPPFSSRSALHVMEKTKIFKALKEGARGKDPADIKKLTEVLVNLSRLVTDYPEISECDINPLFVSPKDIIALDARIELHPEGTCSVPAIRPYPHEYVTEIKKPWGPLSVFIRPIMPEDQALIRHPEISHKDASRLCNVDYDGEMTFVAITSDFILGILEVKRKDDGDYYGKQTLFVKDPDVIAFTQKHLT
ncbi:MAG: acetate--CoA ligase family protein, partial [Candidatus Pacebacteria bacterium]|nr:acetate--CoA ligase family protein [Candidatus Paceibacterota bacterium]